MSDKTTKVMLAAYVEEKEPIGFLSGMFQVPANGFHSSAEVEIDVKRGNRKIAIAVQNLSTGARMNASELFTNKSFKPAILREKAVVNAFDLIGRSIGKNPFESPDFAVNAIAKGIEVGTGMNDKIQRTIELQASQVLQTGIIDLKDEDNNEVYRLDFKAKTTHFPNAGVTWGDNGDDKLGDILSLCKVINTDGKRKPDLLIMGETAFELFIEDSEVEKRLDLRRLEGTGIVPMDRLGNGGIYRGTVEVGNWKLDIWTCDSQYEDPNTGEDVDYIDTKKVLVRSSMGRLDATFGLIPKIGGRDPRVPAELYGRVSDRINMIDVQSWATVLGNGDGLEIEVGTRPLLIPTAIDTFGCLDTTAL